MVVSIQKGIVSIYLILTFLVVFQIQTESADDLIKPELSIGIPDYVNESFLFHITITSNNTPVENVTVTFNGETNMTNSSGIVGFIAPRVSADTNHFYPIKASKEGYNTSTDTITVQNVPQVLPTVDVPGITENTSFIVTTFDDQGRIVSNVTILFNEKEYRTASDGTVRLTAPLVNKSKVFQISAQKPGYIDFSIAVTIYPSISSENFIGFIIVIIICASIIVVTFIIMIRKYLKRKRINRL